MAEVLVLGLCCLLGQAQEARCSNLLVAVMIVVELEIFHRCPRPSRLLGAMLP